jgi:hypothetical protein
MCEPDFLDQGDKDGLPVLKQMLDKYAEILGLLS